MKKIAAMILTLAMLLSLAACATVVKIEPTAAPKPSGSAAPSPDASPTPTPEPSPEPEGVSALISSSADGEEYTADNGTFLMSWSCTTPVVTLRNAPQHVADEINEELRDANSFYYEYDDDSSLSSWLEDARQQYDEWGDELWSTNYYFTRNYNVERCDGRVLSISFSNDSYTGGAHGYYYTDALNFDLATGEELELEDIALDWNSFRSFCIDRIIYLCNTEYDENMFLDGYEEYVPYLIDDADSCYFDSNGLTFVANPYALAVYAAGSQTFTIPYADLEDYIRPEYLPAGSLESGSISGQAVQSHNASLDPELVIDAGTDGLGQPFIFNVTGTVYDVRLENVGFYEYEDDLCYYDMGGLWYASRLDDGDSFELIAWIPDVVPNLRLSYTSAAGSVSVLISQSGKDGSLVLMEE